MSELPTAPVESGEGMGHFRVSFFPPPISSSPAESLTSGTGVTSPCAPPKPSMGFQCFPVPAWLQKPGQTSHQHQLLDANQDFI